MKKLFFHKPGKPLFMNKQTGQQCMLLFTDPLNQETEEGEMAILGMPFFREYEISFDFCTKEMFTKRSMGDCHNIVGKRPSNVQLCSDKQWFSCWLAGFVEFFQGFWNGFLGLFDKNRVHKKANPKKGKVVPSTLKMKPQDLRLSNTAQSLLQMNAGGGSVSI